MQERSGSDMSKPRAHPPPRRGGAAWVALALFGLSFGLRAGLAPGFVLGDDAEEFHLILTIVEDGPDFGPPKEHLKYRFPLWAFNYVPQRLLGSTEAVFFLPTWTISSLLPVLAFAILRSLGYGLAASSFTGLLVAVSPFEILIGSARVNDLFVEFFLALGLAGAVRWRHNARRQGVLLALMLWLAFYAKLWAAFLYPVVGLYTLARWRREGDTSPAVAFVAASLGLHLGSCGFWKIATGSWLPFVHHLSATFPVPRERLLSVLLEYPRMLFVGSEHGTTLFGWVPHLFVAALAVRLAQALRRRSGGVGRLDRFDLWLLLATATFFLMLNFFPNNFRFDHYYSVPRIFRYMAPLSFPLALLAGKLLVDASTGVPGRIRVVAGVLLVLVTAASNVESTSPGRAHRRVTAGLRAELHRRCPPLVVMEIWQSFFFRQVHLPDACPETVVRAPAGIDRAPAHEAWLRERQDDLPPGTVLLTGLVPYVYYPCQTCGFRLSRFERALDPGWKPVSADGPLFWDSLQEPVRLWRWSGGSAASGDARARIAVPEASAERLFEAGMEHFDAQEYVAARAFMGALRERFPDAPLAEDAAYFFAVTFWREQELLWTIREFEALAERYPDGRWTGAAHYHLGLSHRALGRLDEARRAFERAVKTSAPGDPHGRYASDALDDLARSAPWAPAGRALTAFLYRAQAWIGLVPRPGGG